MRVRKKLGCSGSVGDIFSFIFISFMLTNMFIMFSVVFHEHSAKVGVVLKSSSETIEEGARRGQTGDPNMDVLDILDNSTATLIMIQWYSIIINSDDMSFSMVPEPWPLTAWDKITPTVCHHCRARAQKNQDSLPVAEVLQRRASVDFEHWDLLGPYLKIECHHFFKIPLQ